MAKIVRKEAKIFGSAAGALEIGQFGSLAAGAIAYTTDPDDIQALSQYEGGWFDAVVGSNSPAIEDMNALQYLYAYQLAYLMQSGIPEWETNTVYYIGSLATDANGFPYRSITDDNTGNALTDSANWVPFGGIVNQAVNPATDSPYVLTAADRGKTFLVNSANGAQEFTLLAATGSFFFTVKDVGGEVSTNPITIARAASEDIEGVGTDYLCESNYGSWEFSDDGTGWWLS